jgi:hypothetical protein
MRRARNTGRVELASLAAGIAGGAVVALVVWLALPTRERAPEPRAAPSLEGDLSSSPGAGLSALQATLARLEPRLAAIEAALRAAPVASERTPVPQPEGEADPVPLTETQQLHEDLRALESRLDLLTMAWKERDKPTFELPTLDQVHAARRDVDWVWLAELAELYLKDEDAAQQKVRLLTFDQLLKRAGVPTGIRHDDGSWMYLKPEHLEVNWRGVYFGFVGDCVSWVRTDR